MNTFEGNYSLHSLHGTVATFITLVQFYSSDRLADEAISIAIATKENLSHQRGMFSGAAGRMGAVACILLLYYTIQYVHMYMYNSCVGTLLSSMYVLAHTRVLCRYIEIIQGVTKCLYCITEKNLVSIKFDELALSRYW